MRVFDYRQVPQSLLTPRVMNMLAAVHEFRGRQTANFSVKPEVLEAMADVAKIHSTDASNRIEGICTSNLRIRELAIGQLEPRSRAEEEIAGYRDVLALIHDNYEHITLTPGVLLQFHRDLYGHTDSSLGGHFKVGDNEIRGIRPDGTQYVRFRPVPAVATSQAVQNQCEALREGIMTDEMDQLLIALLFVFDFTCIHPFNDGNGRMSRLLTLLLMYKSGYLVGRYVSIEKVIERSKETYYEALAASSVGWETGENNPEPFVCYMLGVMLSAYRDLESRIEPVVQGLSKAERVEAAMRSKLGKVTKAELCDLCPDISQTTVERVLYAMLDLDKVKKVDSGRSTGYFWQEW